MTNPSTFSTGNVKGAWVLSVTLSPLSIAANTTAEQTFSVTGLNVGDFVDVNKPTVQGGLGIVNSRVSALNTLAIGFSNNTASAITPTASEIYALNIARPDNLTAAGNAILSQIT